MRTVNLLICQIISDVLAISFTLVYFFVCSLILSIFMGKCYSTLCLVILLKCIVIFTVHMCFLSDDDNKMQELDEKSAQRDANTARPPARPPVTNTHTQTDRTTYTLRR